MTVPPPFTIQLRPHARRRLGQLWTRLQQQARDDADQISRRNMTAIATPSGRVRPSVLPAMLGDVVGTLVTSLVVGLRHRTIATTPPEDGDVYVWNQAASEWQPEAAGGGHYEIVVTGVINMDGSGELVWEDGDLVYDGPIH